MSLPKTKFITAFLLIIAFTALDYQFFTEGFGQHVPPHIRQIAHLLLLIPVMFIGMWVWRLQPYRWVSGIWNSAYGILMIALFAMGALQWRFNMFSNVVLDNARLLRLIFCSPLPFLFLLLIIWLIRKGKLTV
jgi:hypothetical protein